MKSKAKMIMAIAGAVIVSAAGAGGAVWWFMPKPAVAAAADAGGKHGDAKHAEKEKKEGKPAKYVTLDKVIVMLRRGPNEDTHYLSADLVLATTADKEKETKENLPLLRSLAVRTLSNYTMPEASSMSVDKYAEALNHAFTANYETGHTEQPFSEVMIGKLIIE
jgi:flagellar FliL protein